MASIRSRPLPPIRAMLFDTFGTVVDWRAGIIREATAFFSRHGVRVDAERFADDWRRRYQPAMERIRAGERSFVRLDVLHFENLLDCLRSAGIDPDSFTHEELESLNTAWHRLDPWPDSVEGLTRLRTRFLIAPLSNGNISLLTNMAKRSGLPWDCILGAEVVRSYKPDPRCYLDTVDVLGLQPAECVMVAAHNDDLAAAADTGMQTAFVARPREHGEAQHQDLEATGPWDFVCSDMIELGELASSTL